jgi:[ribosomal protein S18]-alanine N-acetyltransferase
LIRPVEARDVDAILEIQFACPEIAQWSAWDYVRVAHGEMTGWVAQEKEEDAGAISGFLVARRIAGEIEILNLAVRPDARRRGTASELLREAFAWGKSLGATSALLEVRQSNIAALQFYERHGFKAVGQRKQYYVAPVEDALLLKTELQ